MKRFLLGSEVHDEACRAILRESSMGKDVRLSFRREPSFFPAEKIANTWSRLVVLEDDETKTMLGFGVMSGRPHWLNGRAVELGYISQLRLIPEFQNGVYLAKGYRKFKELHEQDKKVPFYVTTISVTTLLQGQFSKADVLDYQHMCHLKNYLLTFSLLSK
jgi:hypothetical protein